MFKKIEPLEYSKHQDLRLSKVNSFAFAGNVSAVNLSFSELRPAARCYPIVFFKDAPLFPQALLSLAGGKNACIDKNGQWKHGLYVPVSFRLYPFTLAKIQDQEGKYALCLDPDAEHFKAGMGDPLFTADGKPTEFVQTVFKSLETYQKELEATLGIFKSLDEKELIVDRSFKYRVNQEEKSIDGFKGVDMKKLTTLDDQSLANMVKNGTMGLVYEQVSSLANFSNFLKR